MHLYPIAIGDNDITVMTSSYSLIDDETRHDEKSLKSIDFRLLSVRRLIPFAMISD